MEAPTPDSLRKKTPLRPEEVYNKVLEVEYYEEFEQALSERFVGVGNINVSNGVLIVAMEDEIEILSMADIRRAHLIQ